MGSEKTGAKDHWNSVYQQKGPADVSWFQTEPATSLLFIDSIAAGAGTKIIDVGGGASVLAQKLLEKGFKDITVLDISKVALRHAQERLGARNWEVQWIEESVTEFAPSQSYEIWHDRAVFHFLTDPDARRSYVNNLMKAVPKGFAIISTFSLDGPERCSGLKVARYDSSGISNEMGKSFKLLRTVNESHFTPWQSEQKFSYFLFERL